MYVLIGVLAGFLSGLFGVGGGFIIVPLLATFLGFTIKQASATSLTAIAITALAGTLSYALSDGVIWFAAILLSIGSVIGSYIGARLLRIVPTVVVLWIFVALVLALALRLLLTFGQGDAHFSNVFGLATDVALFLLGFIAGILAGLLGVGGGIIVVPLLVMFFGMSSFAAKGTSLVMLIPASIVGTWVNLKSGFVDLPAGISIGIIAGAVSFAGVLVAKLMPESLNHLLFAVLMIGVAVQFGIRAIRMRQNAHRPVD